MRSGGSIIRRDPIRRCFKAELRDPLPSPVMSSRDHVGARSVSPSEGKRGREAISSPVCLAKRLPTPLFDLEAIAQFTTLAEIGPFIGDILAGRIRGRVVVALT